MRYGVVRCLLDIISHAAVQILPLGRQYDTAPNRTTYTMHDAHRNAWSMKIAPDLFFLAESDPVLPHAADTFLFGISHISQILSLLSLIFFAPV